MGQSAGSLGLGLRLRPFLPEHTLPSRIANGDDRWISNLPFYRDGIELCPHSIDLAKAFKPVLTPHYAVKDHRNGGNAVSGFSESEQQREVVKLSHHYRPNALSLKPFI